MSFAYSVADLRRIEHGTRGAGLSLMERAGAAAADFLRQRFGRHKTILIIAGPGNNGGDALVAARLLREAGYPVHLAAPDHERGYQHDAAQAWRSWQDAGGIAYADFDQDGRYGAVVDGLFGIGLNRALEGRYGELAERINRLGIPVLSLDVPSGVLADSGAVPGPAIRARWTLAMLAATRGLYTGAALDHVGELHCATLGIDARDYPVSPLAVFDQAPASLSRLIRRQDSHKGSYGAVQILGGSDGMIGAALLAGRAAVAVGCGRVSLGLLASGAPSVDPLQPELMLHGADLAPAGQVAVVGPGLGQSEQALEILETRIVHPQILLLDADALNLLARHHSLRALLRQRQTPTIITPHPTEAARLLGCDTRQIQEDRFTAVRALAERLGVTAILKGAGSLIANGAGAVAINQSGGPALANAGQGDALAGMLAGLLAQDLEAFDAATCAVWLHGRCADAWLAREPGRLAVSASQVIAEAGTELARALAER